MRESSPGTRSPARPFAPCQTRPCTARLSAAPSAGGGTGTAPARTLPLSDSALARQKGASAASTTRSADSSRRRGPTSARGCGGQGRVPNTAVLYLNLHRDCTPKTSLSSQPAISPSFCRTALRSPRAVLPPAPTVADTLHGRPPGTPSSWLTLSSVRPPPRVCARPNDLLPTTECSTGDETSLCD